MLPLYVHISTTAPFHSSAQDAVSLCWWPEVDYIIWWVLLDSRPPPITPQPVFSRNHHHFVWESLCQGTPQRPGIDEEPMPGNFSIWTRVHTSFTLLSVGQTSASRLVSCKRHWHFIWEDPELWWPLYSFTAGVFICMSAFFLLVWAWKGSILIIKHQ